MENDRILRGAIFCLILALAACTSANPPRDGTLSGFVLRMRETANPEAAYQEKRAYDDKRCRDFGFTPGSETYGNCRLRLEESRENRAAAPVVQSKQPELSFMCKDAIARGDSGAISTFC